MGRYEHRSIAVHVRIAVSQLGERLEAHRTVVSRGVGLTQGEFNALVALGQQHSGIPLGELARLLSVKAPNLTVTARNLEAKGLASRIASDDDRRSVSLHITSEGRDLLRRALPEDDAAMAAHLAKLTTEEITLLIRLLQKMIS